MNASVRACAAQLLARLALSDPKNRMRRAFAALAKRYRECSSEKNGSLVRSDVVRALGCLFRATGHAPVETYARLLIASEKDDKAQKKQLASWRAATT